MDSGLPWTKHFDISSFFGLQDDEAVTALSKIQTVLENEKLSETDSTSSPADSRISPAVQNEEIDFNSLYEIALSAIVDVSECLPRCEKDYEEYLMKVCSVKEEFARTCKETLLSQKSNPVMHVKVLRADGLVAKDLNGFSDPFCTMAVIQEEHTKNLSEDLSDWKDDKEVEEMYTTSTIPQTLEPEWNEDFEMEITDRNNRYLAIEVWDNDDAEYQSEVKVSGIRKFMKFLKENMSNNEDDFLGKVFIPLKGVSRRGVAQWFDLLSHHGNPRGRIQVFLETKTTLPPVEEDRAMELYTQLYRLILADEIKKNGEILDTWDGRVSPLGEELLNIVADRLNFKKLHQGASMLNVVFKGVISHPQALLRAVKDVHDNQDLLGYKMAAPSVKKWVGRAVTALKELRLQAQQFVEDHQFRIASDTKKGAIILEAHTQILKVIYDIYPFTISVMLSNTDMVARRFDDVVTSAIESSATRLYKRLKTCSHETIKTEPSDVHALATVGTLRGMTSYLVWSKEDIQPIFERCGIDYFAMVYTVIDCHTAEDLEELRRCHLKETHEAFLSRTVKEFVALRKHLPSQKQDVLQVKEPSC